MRDEDGCWLTLIRGTSYLLLVYRLVHPCVPCGSDKTMLSWSPIGADAHEAVSYLLVVRPGGEIPLGRCLQAMKLPRVECGVRDMRVQSRNPN